MYKYYVQYYFLLVYVILFEINFFTHIYLICNLVIYSYKKNNVLL